MNSHQPRRRKTSTYYHRYALTSRQRRQSRPGLGLHRLPDLRLPSIRRYALEEEANEIWQDEDSIDIPVKVQRLPQHPAVKVLIVLFLIVLGFICIIPLIGMLKVIFNGV